MKLHCVPKHLSTMSDGLIKVDRFFGTVYVQFSLVSPLGRHYDAASGLMIF